MQMCAGRGRPFTYMTAQTLSERGFTQTKKPGEPRRGSTHSRSAGMIQPDDSWQCAIFHQQEPITPDGLLLLTNGLDAITSLHRRAVNDLNSSALECTHGLYCPAQETLPASPMRHPHGMYIPHALFMHCNLHMANGLHMAKRKQVWPHGCLGRGPGIAGTVVQSLYRYCPCKKWEHLYRYWLSQQAAGLSSSRPCSPLRDSSAGAPPMCSCVSQASS